MLKSKSLIIFLGLTIGCLSVNCKKDEPKKLSFFSVKVDGVLKAISDVTAYRDKDDNIIITVNLTTGEKLQLTMGYPGLAPYGFYAPNPILKYSLSNNSHIYAGSTLVLKIILFSENERRVSGEFNTSSPNSNSSTPQLTEGKFEVYWESKTTPVFIPGA